MSDYAPSAGLVEKCAEALSDGIVYWDSWSSNIAEQTKGAWLSACRQDAEDNASYDLDLAARGVLKAAVDSGELVPKSWLVKCGFWSEQMEADPVFETSKGLDSEKSNAFQDWVPVYRIIELVQPNDGGE